MKAELISGSLAFDSLSDEWDSLSRRGITNTPFQSLAYQKSWWTNLAPSSAELQTIAARLDDQTLVGIGCFYLENGVLHFNGCVEETDYLDLISPPEYAKDVWEAIIDCLANGETLGWQALELCNIPMDSPTRSILPTLAERYNLSIREEQVEVCPTIVLPGSYEEYLDRLGSKARRELNRKQRRAMASEATTTVIGPEDDIVTAVNEFLDLLQMSTLEKRGWLNDGRRALFHDVARGAQNSGTLQLMFLELEGRRAAALFNFDYDGRIWVYNSGLDPSLASSMGLGVVLTGQAIEQAIQLGRSEFDFLRGDEAYKYRFGATDQPLYRLKLER